MKNNIKQEYDTLFIGQVRETKCGSEKVMICNKPFSSNQEEYIVTYLDFPTSVEMNKTKIIKNFPVYNEEVTLKIKQL